MAETIDSLLVNLGLETDEQSFSDANAAFDQLQSKALQFGATIGAGFGLNELTFNFAEATNEINKLSEEFEGLGVTPQFISNLQTAFRLIDEDAGEAESTIRSIADLVEDTDWGEISEQAFARGFDVSAIQNAETAQEVLTELNRQMREMEDPERARRMASALGLGGAQFRLLRGTDVGEQMARGQELNPLTEAQTDAARQFQEGFAELTASFDGLSRVLSEQFVGDLGESMSAIADMMAENRDAIRELVETYGPAIADAAKGIGILVGLQAARAGLGILSKIPGSTLLAGGAAIGIGALSRADEGTQQQQMSENEAFQQRFLGPTMSLDDAEQWLNERGGSIRSDAGGDMGKIPLIQRPGPEETGLMDRIKDQLGRQPSSGGIGPSPMSQTIQIDVDARGATDPNETRRQVERGVNSGIARAAENALLDIRTNVS